MKSITDYMMTLHKQFQTERGVSDSTASQYIKSLYSLNNSTAFTNLAWLKNIKAVEQRISEFAQSTQKTLYSVIVSALSLVKEKPTYKKVYSHYYSKMMERSKEEQEKDTTEKTEKQEQNWLEWDVVKAHEQRLKEEVEGLKSKTDLTAAQWEVFLSYMLLSLFTNFDPRRNQDYQFMYVVKSPKQATDATKNYITLMEPRQFIFNKYKTAKSHGQQTFPVPASLDEALTVYLNAHPLLRTVKATALDKKVGVQKDGVPLLVSFDGQPLTAVNAITRLLNRIFGKRVGSTMLRHIYLSNKYDVQEMNGTAEKMAHTPHVQRSYMKKESAQEVNIPEME